MGWKKNQNGGRLTSCKGFFSLFSFSFFIFFIANQQNPWYNTLRISKNLMTQIFCSFKDTQKSDKQDYEGKATIKLHY